jgi:hypothetical protein
VIRALCALALLALAACANQRPVAQSPVDVAPPPPREGYRIETMRVAIPVDARVVRLHLVNPHGDVRVRMHDLEEVGIVATVQLIGEQPTRPEFAHALKGDELGVRVTYRWGEPTYDPETGQADHGRGRADLAVFVPRRLALALGSLDGRIQVRRATGHVEATSRGGLVEVSTAGTLDLRTERGRAVARLETPTPPGDSRIEVGPAALLVAVPMDGDLAVDLDVGGMISGDPALGLVTNVRPGGRATAQRSFGRATARLLIRAEGDVHLVPVLRTRPPTH